MYNNWILFFQHQLAKPGPVSQDTCEVGKVIQYHKAPRTGILEYKVRWLGHSLQDNLCINAKYISIGILHHFCTEGSFKNHFKRRRTNNVQPDRYQRDKALTIIEKEQD